METSAKRVSGNDGKGSHGCGALQREALVRVRDETCRRLLSPRKDRGVLWMKSRVATIEEREMLILVALLLSIRAAAIYEAAGDDAIHRGDSRFRRKPMKNRGFRNGWSSGQAYGQNLRRFCSSRRKPILP